MNPVPSSERSNVAGSNVGLVHASAVGRRSGLRDLAASLRSGNAGLDASTARLVRTESSAEQVAEHQSAQLRSIAHAGGVQVPVMVPPTAWDAYEMHPAVVEAEHIVRARALELAARRRRSQRRSSNLEPVVVGGVATLLAAITGIVLAVGAGRLPGDAISRVAAAQAMVAGRDPHPESIGFIWGPFPTAFEAPLVLLRHVWPDLSNRALAGVIVSAVCLGVMAAQLIRWGRDCGSPRWFRVAAVALVLAHPLILLYGANGMSETCWLMFLVIAMRQLSRWWESDDVVALTASGLALGAAYLTRYESVAAIGAGVMLVTGVAWQRAALSDDHRTMSARARSAGVDVAVFLFPAIAAVAGWAFVSWVVIGEPLAQFTSQYGNRALVVAGQAGNAALVGDLSAAGRAWFFARQFAVAAPMAIPIVLVGCWIGGRTVRRIAAVVTVFGAPIAVQALLAVQGQTFPWFRYVVPAVVLAGAAAIAAGGSSAWVSARGSLRPLLILSLIPGVLMSWAAVSHGDLGSEDDQLLLDGIAEVASGSPVDPSESVLELAGLVAANINEFRKVAPGAVLTDTSSTSAVVAAAKRPELFVIPSDRDFLPVVADPALFGIRYVLLRSPATPGDAVVRAYPELWNSTDDPLARRVRSWGNPEDSTGEFRLFEIKNPRGEPRATPTEEPGR